MVEPGRTRPLRLLMAGTGPRARVLAEAMRHVPGLTLDGVASPHATALDLAPFGHCPAWTDVSDALDDMRPEGLVVASATASHAPLLTLALERGIPCLVEKPVGRSRTEVEEVRALADAKGVPVLVAHNDVFVPGFDRFEALAKGAPVFAWSRRVGPRDAEVPRVWSRAAVSELVQHALSMLVRLAGPVVSVSSCDWSGEMAPQRMSWSLAHASGASTLSYDFTQPADVLAIAAGAHEFKREGRHVTLDGQPHAAPEGELVAMLSHFREVVHGRAAPRVPLSEGLDVLLAARLLVTALDDAGAPLDRANSPKHVASRELAGPRDPP